MKFILLIHRRLSNFVFACLVEQTLLIDAYGCIGALMIAEEEAILQNCPVSTETAGRVVAFFSRGAQDQDREC